MTGQFNPSGAFITMKTLLTAAFMMSATAAVAQSQSDPNILNMYNGSSVEGTAGKAEIGGMRPPASYTGQWYIAPNGCSYSRAKAPGYDATWHLILNPHHLGQKPAPDGCPSML